MIPIINFLGKSISIYMIIAIIGVLTVLLFTYKKAERRGLNEINMLYLVLFAFAGALIFSHILYSFTVPEQLYYLFANLFNYRSFDEFVSAATLAFGGAVFYGGLIGALICGGIYAKRAKLSAEYIDLGACAIPLFHTFGRVGCFLGGCCYGIQSDFGFVYHYAPDPAVNGVTRFPVQLVESAFNLCLFLLLYTLLRRRLMQKRLLSLYLVCYPAARFLLEYLRGDALRGHIGAFSTSQLISIPLFIIGAVWLCVSTRKSYHEQRSVS